MKWTRYGLGALPVFGALNAMAGGYYGMSGAPGVPLEWLRGSRFTDYFLPSLILFVVVGGALLTAAVLVLARSPRARAAAIGASGIVLAGIAVQVAIIGFVSWMQPATALASVVALLLAIALNSQGNQ
jgi:hypothetical protein